MKKQPFLLVIILLVTIASCSKENEETLRGSGNTIPACDTVNMRLSSNVLPILTSNCFGCHGNGRAMGGVNLDTYANIRQTATSGSLLGVITHASGFSPMPKNAAKLSDCDINKIRAWINRGALNN